MADQVKTASTPDLDALSAALAGIDADTNRLATATTTVQIEVNDLLAKIAANPDPTVVKTLATTAQGVLSRLNQVTSDLEAMGKPTVPPTV